jgi:hypothetical protein
MPLQTKVTALWRRRRDASAKTSLDRYDDLG